MYRLFNTENNNVAVAAIGDESGEPAEKAMPIIPDWKFYNFRGLGTIKRTFEFKNLNDAMSFTARVAKLAEFEGITPVMLVEWGKATIGWHIHKKNISVKDLSLIHKIEATYRFLDAFEKDRAEIGF